MQNIPRLNIQRNILADHEVLAKYVNCFIINHMIQKELNRYNLAT